MNSSRQQVERSGLMADGGAPRCPACRIRLSFVTDQQGRVMEICRRCGYRAYVVTRRTPDEGPEPAPTP
ncbi:MAG TPA: hypothetical protein VH163_04435 [Gemmatimonadales bacterium]|nr:hypothetical protein [Gemmatimonadales bacterium]HEX4633055.1 hypothetical protein [Gemmatimonadales bacterium]